MVEAIIHRDLNCEETPVFLTLPASRWDILEAQTKLGVGSLNECFFEYEPPADIPRLASTLKAMWREQNFFNELNYFAHRLAEMDTADRNLLNGALAIHNPTDMQALINLAWHLDSIATAKVSSDAELGQFLADNDFMDFPEDILPYLDFAKIGAEHRRNSKCAFDRNLYYEDINPQIAEVYDGRTLPEIGEPTHIFSGWVFNSETDPAGANKIFMGFPATQQELDDITHRLGAYVMDELTVTVQNCPIARFSKLFSSPVMMIDLDVLASGIDRLTDDQYIKLLAVMESTQADGIHEIKSCVCRLDNYDFIPAVTTADICSFGLVRFKLQEQIMVHEPEQNQDFGGMAMR